MSVESDLPPLNAIRAFASAALSRVTLLHDTHDLWPAFLDAAFGRDMDRARGLRLDRER